MSENKWRSSVSVTTSYDKPTNTDLEIFRDLQERRVADCDDVDIVVERKVEGKAGTVAVAKCAESFNASLLLSTDDLLDSGFDVLRHVASQPVHEIELRALVQRLGRARFSFEAIGNDSSKSVPSIVVRQKLSKIVNVNNPCLLISKRSDLTDLPGRS